ncbi:MAG TPA: flagellin FliC, partial [Solirubrobacteraceae bacterium]|nr:flagellin FliC [Solirubrobacteraceae bacterium]
MSLRINHNIEALNAHRQLVGTNEKIKKAMERLSSGYRINRGGDDAAGLGISERMRAQIRGLGQAQRNTQDGISMVQTAEGSLAEVHAMLQRIRELAVQYKNGSLSSSDRTAISSEVSELTAEIDRIGLQAEFNGIKLLDANDTITFQVGANDGDVIAVNKISLSGAMGTLALTLSTTSTSDLTELDNALSVISQQRAAFGAVQNRFEHTL